MIKLYFKKSIVLFWTLWWLIALWTDVVGALAHQGLLLKSWAPDANYPHLLQSLKMYPYAEILAPVFYGAIILGCFISSAFFCRASFSLTKPPSIWLKRADLAFITSLCLWFAFCIADQMVMKFDLEENHMVQAGFEFLSYLSLYLLPNSDNKY